MTHAGEVYPLVVDLIVPANYRCQLRQAHFSLITVAAAGTRRPFFANQAVPATQVWTMPTGGQNAGLSVDWHYLAGWTPEINPTAGHKLCVLPPDLWFDGGTRIWINIDAGQAGDFLNSVSFEFRGWRIL